MCEHGSETVVRVKIPADLSYNGQERWKNAKIDGCIAPLVDALNKGGIYTRSSCCGHGRGLGGITLENQGELIILSPDVARRYFAFKGNPEMQAAVLLIATYGLMERRQ